MLEIKTFKKIVILIFILLLPYCVAVFNHIGEDCFISFRYAENLAQGNGLVFNQGEWVEGYSNFLYVIILSVFSFFGMDVVIAAKVLSVLFYGLIIFPASFFFIYRGQKKVHPTRLFVPIALFFNPMMHYFADRALETHLFILLLIYAIYFVKRRKYLYSSIFFLCVTLTRPEGFIYFFAGALFPIADAYRLFVKERKNINWVRTLSLREFFLPFIIGFSLFILWRYLTYGYVLPNTVYAKVSKWNFIHNPSLIDLWHFNVSWSFIPILTVISFIFLVRVKKGTREKKGVFILGVTSLLIILYNIYIGKVPAEKFRHLVPIVPLFIIIIGEAYRVLADKIKNYKIMWVIGIIVGLASSLTVNNYDAPKSRLQVKTMQFLTTWDIAERVRWFLHPPIFHYAEAGREIKKLIPRNSLVAADQMGQLGYYSGLKMIDMLGLIDRHIAHNGFSKEYIFKRDPDYFVIYGKEGIPYIPYLAELVKDEEFNSKYQLIYLLRWHVDVNEFLVYCRKSVAEAKGLREPEVIYVGVNKEDFFKKWRM